tara:strand:+ start:200 stop:424 length:225 start_codon:yes stop_codon:yes gene_type:complete
MNETEFYRFIEDKLELKKNSIKKDTILKDIEDWDSLAILTFIVVMDTDFKKKINNKIILKAKKGIDLYKIFKSK